MQGNRNANLQSGYIKTSINSHRNYYLLADYYRMENIIMNELSRNQMLKPNYYALLLAVAKNVSAKDALIEMGISPDNANKEVVIND